MEDNDQNGLLKRQIVKTNHFGREICSEVGIALPGRAFRTLPAGRVDGAPSPPPPAPPWQTFSTIATPVLRQESLG